MRHREIIPTDDHQTGQPNRRVAAQINLTQGHWADSEFTARGLHHSDAGSQYTALAFTEELAEARIAGSIGTIGDALDNALMESTIDLYKTECITPAARGCNWTSLRDVERETAEWVRWYNHEESTHPSTT
jgi:transposase InsO family protein